MKIVATRTDARWGYLEGDVLEVVEVSTGCYGSTIYSAKNLTNGHLFSREYVFVSDFECVPYEEFKEYEVVEQREFKIFGIPIYKKEVKKLKEGE